MQAATPVAVVARRAEVWHQSASDTWQEVSPSIISQFYRLSSFQNDVISVLSSIASSGYRLDALVEVNGIKVGIEVDGPSHFMNQEPKGSTLLKRRQVNNLDYIPIISVPHWEWQKLGSDHLKKQIYLRSILFDFAESTV
jgi:hypothetical protein